MAKTEIEVEIMVIDNPYRFANNTRSRNDNYCP
jgi:hypothetical protein